MPITMEPHSGPSLVGMLKQAWEAMKAPGKAYNEGMTPDEMIKAGNDFAMTMGGGGSLVPKPANSLGMFGGRLAKTANLEKLAQAEKFEKVGVHPDTIWKATGWGRGKDGQWRFEIPDNKASMKPNADMEMEAWGPKGDGTFGHNAKASDVIDHEELFKAYPALRETTVVPDNSGNLGSSYGGKIGLRTGRDATNTRSTMLHEMQHEVQKIENFARGNNGSMPEYALAQALHKKITETPNWDDKVALNNLMVKAIEGATARQSLKRKLYNNTAGEVESRNVQSRRDYSSLQRALRSPWATEDVPRNLQLVLGIK
jgi:hypothetical protein